MNTIDTYCSRCGEKYLTAAGAYPKTCTRCGVPKWLNPTPVMVAIAPVGSGVLAIRRGIEPQIGKLALPGGFHVVGETWAEGAAREVYEETGQRYNPKDIRVMSPYGDWQPMFSTAGGNLLIFTIFPRIEPEDLVTNHVDEEILGVEILYGPTELAFPAHTEALKIYFEQMDQTND
jgi:8-oxo-dGTP pyrophosphatase MutT (NUDIX family)